MKRINRITMFSLCVLSLLFMFSNSSIAQTCISPPSGMVAWWPLDETSDSTAADIVGTNSGTHVNGPTPIVGKVAGALSFDGADDFVEIPTSTLKNLTQGTVDMWVRILDLGENQARLFALAESGLPFPAAEQWSIDYRGTGAIEVALVANGVIVMAAFTAPNIIVDIDWHHIAVVSDGVDPIQIYVDGLLLPTTDPLGTNPNGDFFFADAPNADNMKIGAVERDVVFAEGQKVIDELEIFDRALSASEIQAIYSAGSAGKCKVIIVEIDIKPGSDPNSINLCSNGAVPVVIFGSDTFNVADVNTETLRFAAAAVKVVGKKDPHSLCSYGDINGDFIDDLVCHYVTTDIAGIDGESTSATVNGELIDMTPFEGTDSVNIVKDTCN